MKNPKRVLAFHKSTLQFPFRHLRFPDVYGVGETTVKWSSNFLAVLAEPQFFSEKSAEAGEKQLVDKIRHFIGKKVDLMGHWWLGYERNRMFRREIVFLAIKCYLLRIQARFYDDELR